MKKRLTIKSFAIVFFLFIASKISAQENSLLWKIEGNGFSKPSYLFGTIHATCQNDFEFKTKVSDALTKVEKLVLEVDVTDPKEMQVMQQLMVSDKTISSQLTDNQQNELDSLLKKYVGMPLNMVDKVHPVMLVSLMSLKYFACDYANLRLFEMELSQRAAQQNIPIVGLETFEQQMKIMENAISLEEIIRELHLFPEGKALYADLVKAYKTENTAELYQLLNDEKFMNEVMKTEMLDNRNKNWIRPMEQLMSQHACMFAVGAAHLLGNEGVIALLKAKGYNVEAVY